MAGPWYVGILLFDDVEVLDFAGPFEVFSLATYPESNEKAFVVKTVAQTKRPVRARNGLVVVPDYDFVDAPPVDILVIPGGFGAEEVEIHNDTLIQWIRDRRQSVELMVSVCTGALLLAKAGLLDGRSATTHWIDIDRLESEFPLVSACRGVKFVDDGDIITAGGISAGINMSFHVIKRLLGAEVARGTAKRMEYDLSI